MFPVALEDQSTRELQHVQHVQHVPDPPFCNVGGQAGFGDTTAFKAVLINLSEKVPYKSSFLFVINAIAYNRDIFPRIRGPL